MQRDSVGNNVEWNLSLRSFTEADGAWTRPRSLCHQHTHAHTHTHTHTHAAVGEASQPGSWLQVIAMVSHCNCPVMAGYVFVYLVWCCEIKNYLSFFFLNVLMCMFCL